MPRVQRDGSHGIDGDADACFASMSEMAIDIDSGPTIKSYARRTFSGRCGIQRLSCFWLGVNTGRRLSG